MCQVVAKDRPYIVIQKRRKQRKLEVPAGFALRQQGSLTLTLPDKQRGLWPQPQRIFRSLIYDRRHQVVSCSLPKFFLQQQDPEYRAEAERLLGAGTGAGAGLQATVKYDGSLLIRSVIRGQVVFRTRSSFDGQHYQQLAEVVAAERYPILLDPDFAAQCSLHFEFVSPKQRIIINYSQPDLVLLGAVDHQTLRLAEYAELEDLSQQFRLRLTEAWPLEQLPKDIQALQELIDQNLEIEGLVLRWAPGRLLKVKSTRYELAQEQRYQLHPRKIYRLCRDKNIQSPEQLLQRLKLSTNDPLADYLSDLWRSQVELSQQLQSTITELRSLVAETSSRKAAQKLAQTMEVPRSLALLALYDHHDEHAYQLLETHWVKERFTDPSTEGLV